MIPRYIPILSSHFMRFSILTALVALLVTSNLRAEVIADSINEFSGVQGQDDWRYGYRNYTLDGEENDYDPVADFIEFAPSDWRGSAWDLEPAASGPWTNMAAETGHPNGGGNHDLPTNEEHWTIRRWVATSTDVPGFTPLAVTWHIREVNLAGNGVTGGVHHNGIQVDAVALEGGDDVGVERTYYINALPGDFIDLIMSPEGASGDRNDGSDGSANWMIIDTDIPADPEQPDGTPFEPASDSDTDADGLPDSWEEVYFPDDLTKLSSDGDYDEDGLSDGEELSLSSNPTITDTDGDTLLDGVENGTGVFVDASNAGTSPTQQDTDGDGLTDPDEINGDPATNPTKTDTDDDGFSDPAEILAGTNPNDAADSPVTFVIADSIAEFSGIQGQDGWYYGYRNYTLDEKGNDYDPAADFIAFTGGSDNADEWDGMDQQWSGTQWDLETAAAGPWTALGAEGAHPNGTNSDPGEEHWVIRRWISDVAETTPVSLWWTVRKTNGSGGGVSGSLNIDGKQIDAATIGGSDTVGTEHRYWYNLAPGEVIDLGLTPEGTADRNDGSDGSAFWLRVDAKEFADPRYQPNGDLFIPSGAEDSDGDNLPDFWERIYFPDDLTKLASGQDSLFSTAIPRKRTLMATALRISLRLERECLPVRRTPDRIRAIRTRTAIHSPMEWKLLGDGIRMTRWTIRSSRTPFGISRWTAFRVKTTGSLAIVTLPLIWMGRIHSMILSSTTTLSRISSLSMRANGIQTQTNGIWVPMPHGRKSKLMVVTPMVPTMSTSTGQSAAGSPTALPKRRPWPLPGLLPQRTSGAVLAQKADCIRTASSAMPRPSAAPMQ
jgi:hypothetical protein